MRERSFWYDATLVLREESFSNARGPSISGADPGGADSAFCDPEYMASTPQSSAKNGTPPNEQTVSARKRVPLALQTSPMPLKLW